MKKVFITGRPGVGKTTAVVELVKALGERAVGFYTKEIRDNGVRMGFEIVTTWGETYTLAHVGIEGPKVSKYGVDTESIEKVVSRLRAVEPGKILVIDEIGKMEMMSKAFMRWVEKMIFSTTPVVGTLPLRWSHPLLNRIKRSFPVWEVTPDNRSAIPVRLMDFLKEGCGGFSQK